MIIYLMAPFMELCYISSGWCDSVIKNIGFGTLSKDTKLALYNIGLINVHTDGLGNRHDVLVIILPYYEYLTRCPSEN